MTTLADTIERVAPGVWVGIPARYGEGAMGVVVGSDGALVVDTTSYNVFAARFLAKVGDAEGRSDWPFLVVTHRHFDHFAGADAIPATVIAHRLTRIAMAGYTEEWMSQNIAAWTKQDMIIPELVDNPRVILPQIVFDHQLDIHLGDVEVQLLHVGGHTTDQVVVYIPARRVLFGSDNIFHKRTPFIGHGDLVTWIDALERLSRLPIDIVVPGHGSIGGPELVTAQIDELKELLDRSLRGE